MAGTKTRSVLVFAVLIGWLQPAVAAKVMFRDELTGCEMWRLSSDATIHNYDSPGDPWSYDGRRIIMRWEGRVLDLKDGAELLLGGQHPGVKDAGRFVRGASEILYHVRHNGHKFFLHDLKTGQERKVLELPEVFGFAMVGLMGPNSEYMVLQGDFNDDGLSDWAMKPLRTSAPVRIVWSDPGADVFAYLPLPLARCASISSMDCAGQ